MKLKLTFIILLIGGAIVCHAADTNPPVQILVTNWIQPTVDFRVVGGQVYNTRYSVKWGPLDNIVSLHNGQRDYAVGTITARHKFGDYTICGVEAVGTETTSYVKDIAIRNLPESITTGDPLPVWNLRVMRVKNMQFGSDLLETFDCGIQATNLIPVPHYVTMSRPTVVK